MRLTYRSIPRRILGNLRFLICRAWHGNKMRAPFRGSVDSQCRIYVGSKAARLQIGEHFIMASYSTLFTSGNLEIGNHVFLNHNARVICRDEIQIGDYCIFGPYVTILDHDHVADFVDGQLHREQLTTRPVRIGKNVWIGEKTTILKGVSIGENTVIGANSVVTHSIPSNCIATGSPAKIMRELRNLTSLSESDS